jgi:hypothetical protein
MADSTAIEPIICNNSVTGLYYASNVWPAWQITVGAYAYYAHNSTELPIWVDNHAAGFTANHPAYDLCGSVLGGGWSETARMQVDTDESTTIRVLRGNLTLRHHANDIFRVVWNGTDRSMSYYANGTSWAYFERSYAYPYNESYSWINVTVLPITVVTDSTIDITVTQYGGSPVVNWTVDASNPTMTFTLTGSSTLSYRLYQNGTLAGTKNGPTATFEVTGSGTFYITTGYTTEVQTYIDLIYVMLALGLVVGLAGVAMVPLKDPKNRNPKRLTKVLLNAVIYIVVGTILIGVVHEIFIG